MSMRIVAEPGNPSAFAALTLSPPFDAAWQPLEYGWEPIILDEARFVWLVVDTLDCSSRVLDEADFVAVQVEEEVFP
jgi:hypothetical protein